MVHKSVNSPTFSDFGPKLWKLESFLESFLLFPETNMHWNDERGRTSSPVEYHLFAHGRLCLSQDDLFLPIPSIIPGAIFIKNSSSSPKCLICQVCISDPDPQWAGRSCSVCLGRSQHLRKNHCLATFVRGETAIIPVLLFHLSRFWFSTFWHFVKHSKDQKDWYKSWYDKVLDNCSFQMVRGVSMFFFRHIINFVLFILSTRYTHLYWEERSFAAWSAGRQVERRQNT